MRLLSLTLVFGLAACSERERSVDGQVRAAEMDVPGGAGRAGSATADPTIVSDAYRAGSRWRRGSLAGIEHGILPQLAAVSGQPSAQLEAFIGSGRAEAVLVDMYARMALARGSSQAETALLFVAAWEACHDRAATPAEVQGVRRQMSTDRLADTDAVHPAQRRFYELFAAAIQAGREDVASGQRAAFRDHLRDVMLAGSGNDLAEFELTNDGFSRR